MDVLWACTIVVLLLDFFGILTLSFFPRLNVTSDTRILLYLKVHITRKHINTFSHAIIDLTQCVIESFFIPSDVFLNVYSAIDNIFEIIQKSFLSPWAGLIALQLFATWYSIVGIPIVHCGQLRAYSHHLYFDYLSLLFWKISRQPIQHPVSLLPVQLVH